MSEREHGEMFAGPQWRKPELAEEMGELERTAEDLQMNLQDIIEAFDHAELEVLEDETWADLKNTDSRDETWTTEEVISWIKERNAMQTDQPRDIDRIIRAYAEGDTLPSAVVLFRADKPPYLIGGNTRLLVARAKKLVPKILALRSPKF